MPWKVKWFMSPISGVKGNIFKMGIRVTKPTEHKRIIPAMTKAWRLPRRKAVFSIATPKRKKNGLSKPLVLTMSMVINTGSRAHCIRVKSSSLSPEASHFR